MHFIDEWELSYGSVPPKMVGEATLLHMCIGQALILITYFFEGDVAVIKAVVQPFVWVGKEENLILFPL